MLESNCYNVTVLYCNSLCDASKKKPPAIKTGGWGEEPRNNKGGECEVRGD